MNPLQQELEERNKQKAAQQPSDYTTIKTVVGDGSKTKDGITANNPSGQLPVVMISGGNIDFTDTGDDDDDETVATGASPTASFYDKNGNLKSYEQAMADWDNLNAEPEAPALSTAQAAKPMSYEDILAAYDAKNAAADAAEAKRNRSRKNLAMLTDGINAITNLVGTSQGANQTYDPNTNAYSQYQARMDKIIAQQTAERKAYRDLAYRQAALAQKNYATEQGAINAANKNAMTAYQKQQTAHDNARKAYAADFNKERNYQSGQDKFAYTKQHNAERDQVHDTQWEKNYNAQFLPTTNISTSSNSHTTHDSLGNQYTETSNTTTRTTHQKQRR